MAPALGMTLLALLLGTVFSANFQVDINMAGITGYVGFYSPPKSAIRNLNGTCEQISVSVHEFPIMYGYSPEPCGRMSIGNPLYEFTFNKSLGAAVNVTDLFDAQTSLEDLSLLVKTCNRTACGNIRKENGTVRTWQVKFYKSILGEVYFRQQDGEASLTILTDLMAIDEGQSTGLNVSMYFSPTCSPAEVAANVSLGIFEVGTLSKAVKSCRRVPNAKVQQFASLNYKGQWVCAEVKPLEAKCVTALINMNGVRGVFNFKQDSPFGPTQILVNLKNLTGLERFYHVHRLPVPKRRDTKEILCDSDHTGDHWNPFSANVSAAAYPKVPGESHDQYEVGDLSGRHGPLLQGVRNFESKFTDWNLPLFGRNSIVGRSIVIHKADNARLACANIAYEDEVITAVAVFRKTVVGRVTFRQLRSNPYADLSIYIELSYSNVSALPTNNHNWHVHEFPLSTETDADKEACLSTKGHFNPSKIDVNLNYSLYCQPLRPFSCEVGDLAGKQRTISLTSQVRSVLAKAFFTDTTAALTGFGSFLGKSLVIHGADKMLSRTACANITFLPPAVGKTGPWFGSKQVEGEFNVSQNVDLDPTSISVSFSNLGAICGGYHVHKLPIQQNSLDPCADVFIKGHFNPFLINITSSPAPGNGTVDEYEVGDVSGKHGTLTDKNTYIQQFSDSNLPLSGPTSILGRSLVIHNPNGSRLQCANIEPQKAEGAEWVRAKVDFQGAVKGSIRMVQQVFPGGSYIDTTVEVDLHSSETQGMELQWYIPNQLDQQPDTESSGDNMVDPYNPHDIYRGPGYNSSCSPGYPLHCAVGDMMAKHGPITEGARQLVTDANLPLAGDFTVVGRSLLVKIGQRMLDSATIIYDGPVVALVFPTVINFSRYEFRTAVSRVLSEPLWKVNLLPGGPMDASLKGCQQLSFFVIGYNDKMKLESIKDHQEMHKFGPSQLCDPDFEVSSLTGKGVVVASQYLLILWLLLLGLLH